MKILLFSIIFVIFFGLLIPVYSYTENSPYQQWSDGVPWTKTTCKDEFYLIAKDAIEFVTKLYDEDPEEFNKKRLSTHKPVCVQLETAKKLYKRGWAENLENEIWQIMAKQGAEEFIVSNLDKRYRIVEGTLSSGSKGQRDSLPPQITIGVSLSAITDDEKKINLSFNLGISQGDKVKSISAFKWDSDWQNSEKIQLPLQTTWMKIVPIQCRENPWEKEWLSWHSNLVSSLDSVSEHDVIFSYLQKRDILALNTIREDINRVTCAACSCPSSYDLHVLVLNSDVNKMLELGFGVIE